MLPRGSRIEYRDYSMHGSCGWDRAFGVDTGGSKLLYLEEVPSNQKSLSSLFNSISLSLIVYQK